MEPSVSFENLRGFLGDHLDRSEDWLEGWLSALLLVEAIDTYQAERLEDWWNERRSP